MLPGWFVEDGEARRSYRLGSELLVRFHPKERCWLVVFRVPAPEPIYQEEWVDGDRGAMNRAALRAEAIADDWIATQETHVGVVEERLLPGAQSEGT